MQIYKLVQIAGGRFIESEFTDVFAAMEVRGYEFVRLNDNRHQRPELFGQPVFRGVFGPMWDGGKIRYEDKAASKILSA